jgi:hypothetical protein
LCLQLCVCVFGGGVGSLGADGDIKLDVLTVATLGTASSSSSSSSRRQQALEQALEMMQEVFCMLRYQRNARSGFSY